MKSDFECALSRAMERVRKFQAENKRLKEGLHQVRKSKEIMEARRLAEQVLKGE